MKHLNKIIILPLLVLLLAASCKKDKDEEVMPKYTETGQNTFAAYVNGKVWTPKGRPNFYQSNV